MSKPTHVVLLYKRGGQPDEALMRMCETQLKQNGYSVFIDRHLTMGVDWAREIEGQIRSADVVIPLLSADAIHSEMLGFEIETANETAQLNSGRPWLLPVRVNYTGPLPEPLSSILDRIQYFLWEGEQDNLGLVTELVEALKKCGSAESAGEAVKPARTAAANAARTLAGSGVVRPPALEVVGGAVPLDSEYYVPRPVDTELRSSLSNHDSIVLIKGARQMGKTSLLARGLQFARQQGDKAVSTDFQKFNAENFTSVHRFYQTLAESLVEQLEFDVSPVSFWDERRGPNANLERFLRREILAKITTPLVWGLDEVDRLFSMPFSTEFFGLMRSWHNERALDPYGPWSKLTMAIAYATEAHLFITDMNQSPFNVGTRLAVEDFSPLHVADLNRRYHNPIKTQEDVSRFARLVGGHPYLVRRGLHELATRKMSFDSFEEQASHDEGIYGDHLRRILVLLVRDSALAEAMRGILAGQPGLSSDIFYRLRSAGVISGHAPEEARARCRLYTMYLRRHLGV